jgi:hypothetical protein
MNRDIAGIYPGYGLIRQGYMESRGAASVVGWSWLMEWFCPWLNDTGLGITHLHSG